MLLHKIKVTTRIIGNMLFLKAERADMKNIDLKTFLKPYTDNGMKLKRVDYRNHIGPLNIVFQTN